MCKVFPGKLSLRWQKWDGTDQNASFNAKYPATVLLHQKLKHIFNSYAPLKGRTHLSELCPANTEVLYKSIFQGWCVETPPVFNG